jgi:CubicO group peptidase (beta-lactamase class C family)
VETIETVVEQGIVNGTFPGAVVLIEKDGRIVYSIAMGDRQIFPAAEAMTADTLFDLASLTKPLATAPLVLKVCSQEGIDLESLLARYVPEANSATGAVSLRQLLLHTAGLPPVPGLYTEFPDPTTVEPRAAEGLLLARRPESPPGRGVVYSCTGYQLLGVFLRRVTGRRVGELFRTFLSGPCGLEDLFFCPPSQMRGRTAPTEHCPWRGRWIRGEVHDENCWCLGGDAGNAGLFGTAGAVVRLLSTLVSPGRSGKTAPLREPETRLMTTCLTPGLNRRRAVGFMMHDSEAPVGPRYSQDSFGHTGFTGTSVWVEPRRDLKVVALTNRVHLGREETQEGLTTFRIRLHEAVLDEVG